MFLTEKRRHTHKQPTQKIWWTLSLIIILRTVSINSVKGKFNICELFFMWIIFFRKFLILLKFPFIRICERYFFYFCKKSCFLQLNLEVLKVCNYSEKLTLLIIWYDVIWQYDLRVPIWVCTSRGGRKKQTAVLHFFVNKATCRPFIIIVNIYICKRIIVYSIIKCTNNIRLFCMEAVIYLKIAGYHIEVLCICAADVTTVVKLF